MVARNGALNAEKALEALGNNAEHEKDIEVLIEMRDRFNTLEDKILKGEELIVTDYVQLYAGAMVSRNIIQKNIDTWTAIVKEYDDNLIPKLYEISTADNDATREDLIEQYFS